MCNIQIINFCVNGKKLGSWRGHILIRQELLTNFNVMNITLVIRNNIDSVINVYTTQILYCDMIIVIM